MSLIFVSSALYSTMKILCLLLLVGGVHSSADVTSCKTVWEDRCRDEPYRKCDIVQKPHSVSSVKEECNTVYANQCSNIYDTEVDHVAHRQECKTVQVPKQVSVPVKICNQVPELKCDTKYEEKCHTEYEKECTTKYEEECDTTEIDEVCDTSNEYKTDVKKEKKCQLETETQCHDTPSTDCQTVKKPVIKYRDEEECETVYEQVCVPSYEESCHTVTERQCKTVTETECDHYNRCWDEERDECWDEPRQECKQIPKKVCNNVPRQKCTTVHHPYTDYEDKKECTTTISPYCRPVPVYKCHDIETPVTSVVPKKKCSKKPKKVCKKVPKQDCKDVPRQKCDSVPKQDCQTVQKKECHTEYNEVTSYEDKEECKTVHDKVDRKVARQVCNKVPRKECRQMPVTKTMFKDETECNTITEEKCTKVSRTSCGVEDSKVTHTGVAVTSKEGGRVKVEPKSTETDYTVIIVGGGISGLSAARHLTANGIKDIILLEAQNRLGGRMYTRFIDDEYLELGANWIHLDSGLQLYEYAIDKGLPFHEPFTETTEDQVLVKGTASLIQSLLSDINNNLDTSSDVVKLRARVTEIDWNDDFVTVTYQEGNDQKQITADHVISTLPVGVLQSKSVSLPSLSQAKRKAIEEMNPGSRSKLLLHFDEQFWSSSSYFYVGQDVEFSPQNLTRDEPFGDWRDSVDSIGEVKGAPNTLLIWTYNDTAVEEIDASTDREILNEAAELIRALEALKDVDVPAPPRLTRHRWTKDPYALGTWRKNPDGTDPDKEVLGDYKEMLKPEPSDLKPRLFLAGEHTNEISSMLGAFKSGMVQAEELVRLRSQERSSSR